MKKKFVVRLLSLALATTMTISQGMTSYAANMPEDEMTGSASSLESSDDAGKETSDDILIFDDHNGDPENGYEADKNKDNSGEGSDIDDENELNKDKDEEKLEGEGDDLGVDDENGNGDASESSSDASSLASSDDDAADESSLEVSTGVDIVTFDSVDTNLLGASNGSVANSNINYTLSDEGVLTLSGRGAIPDNQRTNMPWYASKDSITEIVIGEGITKVGEYTFSGYSKVTKVTLPSTLQTIAYQAFKGISAETIVIPENVTTIGWEAFASNTNLKKVVIESKKLSSCSQRIFAEARISSIEFPSDITKIPDQLFYAAGTDNCSVTIPKTVTRVGNAAFDGSGISKVTFENGSVLTSIGEYAFKSTNVGDVEIPAGVTSIEYQAFRNSGMENVVIPENVTTIGWEAFAGNKNLQKVVIKSKKLSSCSQRIFAEARISSIEFPSDITKIPDQLFYAAGTDNCSVTIPKTVTRVGNAAFDGSGISKVTFENGSVLTSIGEYAFKSTNVGDVEIPAGVTSIEYQAFRSSGMENVVIPENVTTIGWEAFAGNKNLQKVVVKSKKLSSCSQRIFAEARISSIEFPSDITKIPDQLFYAAGTNDCSVTIPKTVTRIGNAAFDGSGIVSVTFESGSALLSIGEYAFKNTNIEEITIPAGVASIEYQAFRNAKLTEIVIPSKVTTIGWEAFAGNPYLTKVTLPASVTKIADRAFLNDNDLTIKFYVIKNSYAYKWVSDNAKRYNYQIVSVAGIKYVLNGGTNDSANPVTYETGDTIVLVDPARVGYTFAGWFYDAKFTKEVEGSLNTAKGADLTVYAKWTANKYDVTYDVNGGNALENNTISQLTYGGAYPKNLAVPTRTGYTFAGWYTEKTGGNKITGGTTKFTIADPANARIYAHWTPYAYTIRFNSNPPEGKNVTKTQKAKYDTSVILTGNTFKITGGSFAGWNTNKDGSGTTYGDKAEVDVNLVDGSKNNAVVDLYAQWKTVDYVVFLDTGAKAGEASDGSLVIGGTSIPDATPEDFKAATGIDVSTVNGNGYLQAMKYGEEFELSGDEFTRKGYTLTGWKNSKTGKVIKNSAIKNLTTKNEVVTLTAQWAKSKYSVAYNLNGGAYVKGAAKGVATYTVDNVETALPNAAALTRTGYSFEGWYDNKELSGDLITFVGVSKTDEGKDVLKNLTLFAKWKATGHTLTLNVNQGTIGQNYTEDDLTISLNYSDTHKLSSGLVERTGYILDSWNTQADGKGKKYAVNATISKLTGNLELFAIWKVVNYTIKYNLDGGKQAAGVVSYTTNKETVLKMPTKAGFVFNGWDVQLANGAVVDVEYREVNGKDEYYIAANAGNAGNITLLAKWKPVTYSVKLHFDKEESVPAVLIENGYNYGEKYQVNELVGAAQAEGWAETYKISAFSNKPNGAGTKYAVTGVFSNLSAADGAVVDLFAVYGTKNNYTISYDLNGGTLANPVYSYDGTKNVAIADPVKAGYVFKGWVLKENSLNLPHIDSERIIKWGCTPFTTDLKNGVLKKLKILKGSNMNVELTATYEPSKHAVTIDTQAKDAKFAEDFTDANGKTYKAGDVVPAKLAIGSYAYEDSKSLPVFERNGYEFAGFNLVKNGKGVYVTDAGNATTAAKVTLYAIWNAEVYNIYYTNVDAGIANSNATVIKVGTKVILKNLAKKGYTFAGWKLADVSSVTVDEEKVFVNNAATVKVTKNNKGMITQIAANSVGNIALEPVFTENTYTLKISSNGAKSANTKVNPATIALGTKNYSQEVTDELVEKTGLFNAGSGETAVYTKKGFVFAGLATDAKGKNKVMDAAGNAIGVYDGNEIFGLSDKNKTTVTLYAVWEKVVADKPVIKSATLNGAKDQATVVFDVPYTAAEVSYEVQCSSSIAFRRSVTNSEVFDNVSGNTVIIDTATTSGTNHIRIRQIKKDSQGNVVTGKWSKRFAVK